MNQLAQLNWAQWTMIVLFVLAFFGNLYVDVNGREAREPDGFRGIMTTFITFAFLAFIWAKAGVFGH